MWYIHAKLHRPKLTINSRMQRPTPRITAVSPVAVGDPKAPGAGCVVLMRASSSCRMPATEPEQLHGLFEQAFNAGDIEALMALYEPDAALIPHPA